MAKDKWCELPSLFDFDFSSEASTAPTATPKQNAVAVIRKPAKPVLPSYLKGISTDIPLDMFLKKFGYCTLSCKDYYVDGVELRGNNIILKNPYDRNWARNYNNGVGETRQFGEKSLSCAYADLKGDDKYRTLVAKLVYFDKWGYVWKATLTINLNMEFRLQYREGAKSLCVYSYTLSDWTNPNRKRLDTNLNFLQSEETLWDILNENFPYTCEWARKEKVDVRCCLFAPWLETLSKAGYGFAKDFTEYAHLDKEKCAMLNRLCKEGTKPKDIFVCSKQVYSVLKEETDIELWDTYRRLEKTGKIKNDIIQQVYDSRFGKKDLEAINSILAKTYEDKPVFTWNTLVAYLGRLDTFEAIGRQEAFGLLYDYLSMCSQLKMKPRIDGDSLKREHDIAARNVRLKRNEIMAERMTDACKALQKYNYQEGVYLVRGIQSYDDLLDEANQQHNCVASYGDRIASKTSLIFVMRTVANPNQSLITIELAPKTFEVRQKFLAYNQSIHNKSQTEFIERWVRHIKSL